MAEQKHTPEPWEICSIYIERTDCVFLRIRTIDKVECNGILHKTICDVPAGRCEEQIEVENRANANRIVACVNACKDLNPEAVPALMKLIAQFCYSRANDFKSEGEHWDYIFEIKRQLRKALSAVTGGQ